MVNRVNIPESSLTSERALSFSTIGLREILEGDSRLDARFYDLEFRKALSTLGKCKARLRPLYGDSGFSHNVAYPGRFKRVFVDSGIPIFTASQILDLDPKPEKFISNKTKTDIDGLRLKEGQIVMTRSGTIGNLAIVAQTLKDRVFSDDVIRIEFEESWDVGYAYAFLKTSVGKQVLGHNKYGSVIKHIEPDHLKDLLIPDAPSEIKDSINDRIQKVYSLRDQAVTLLENSRKSLFSLLGVKSINELGSDSSTSSNAINTFKKNVSQLNDRFDAWYHNPICKLIEDELDKSAFDLTTLGDPAVSKRIVLPGRFKRIYVGERNGVPFLSGGDITQFLPTQLKYLSRSHHSKRIDRELKLQKDTILITCSGTIGNVLLVPTHYDGWTASQHMVRVIPSNEIDPGYIYAFLSSEYGRTLVRRWSYGAVVPEVDHKQISQVRIPMLSKGRQIEIGNLVLEASQKWSEAFYLERDTINELENLIHRGGL